MEEYDKYKYAVYFNIANPHAIIHMIGCSHVNKHKTGHAHDQGGWGYFAEKYATEQFARAISRLKDIQLRTCKSCIDMEDSKSWRVKDC